MPKYICSAVISGKTSSPDPANPDLTEESLLHILNYKVPNQRAKGRPRDSDVNPMRYEKVPNLELDRAFANEDDKELNQLLNQTFTISSFDESSDGITKELYKLHKPISKTKEKKMLT